MKSLETERLLFREHEMGDLEAFCAMEADPEVRRYVGGAPRAYEDAAQRFRAGAAHWSDDLSLKAVVLKSDGGYIGRAGLYPHMGEDGPISGEASISFYLASAFWGQGYATEAANFWVKRGFEALGVSKIVTMIDARNGASRRVLEKLGFTLYEIESGAREFEKYELRNPGLASILRLGKP